MKNTLPLVKSGRVEEFCGPWEGVRQPRFHKTGELPIRQKGGGGGEKCVGGRKKASREEKTNGGGKER